MFSISQIILIVITFLLLGATLFLFLVRRKQGINYSSLLQYFAPVLFVIFICSEITYFIYYSKFLYYFGMNVAILIMVSLAILAIPAYGLLPREKLHSPGLVDLLKRKRVPVLPAESIPLIIEPEGLKIKEKPVDKPAEIQDEPLIPEEQIQEVKLTPPIEKSTIVEGVKEEEKIIQAEQEAQVVEKAETKPIPVEHRKTVTKKVTAKKQPAKKEEVKKGEVKKDEVKPVEVKHVKTAHPKTTHTKTGTEKQKQPRPTKPRTKK